MEKINKLITELVKEFELGGVKNFLANFDLKYGKLKNTSIFLGSVGEIVYMTNGVVLEGYIKGKGHETLRFVFKSTKEQPWIDVYNPEIKEKLLVFTQKQMKTNEALVRRFKLILSARGNAETLIRRALANKFIKFDELNINTQLCLMNPDEPFKFCRGAQECASTIEKDVVADHGYDLSINVMALAHAVRKNERLEGHYHVQMRLALRKAHAMLKSASQIPVKAEKVIEEVKVKPQPKSTSTVDKTLADNAGKYTNVIYYVDNVLHINDKAKVTNLKGVEMELWIKNILSEGNLNSVIVIYHHNVFDGIEMKGIDFVKVPI